MLRCGPSNRTFAAIAKSADGRNHTLQDSLPFVVNASRTLSPLATLPAMVGHCACDEEFELLSGQIHCCREEDGAVAFVVKIIGKERLEI